MDGTEQRVEQRVGYKTQAVVSLRGTKYSTRTINLSRSGIRVLAPQIAASEDELVEVQLTFSWTSEWVRIPAQLVYEHSENGMRFWGLRFRNVPKDARILISLFINAESSSPRPIPSGSAPVRSASPKPRPPPPRKKSSIRSLIDDVVQYLHEDDAFKPKGKKFGR